MRTSSAHPFRGLLRPAPLPRPAVLPRLAALSFLTTGAFGAFGALWAFGAPTLPDAPALSHSRTSAPDPETDTPQNSCTQDRSRTQTSDGSPESHAWSLPVPGSNRSQGDQLTTRS
jgi:hypothetical protein